MGGCGFNSQLFPCIMNDSATPHFYSIMQDLRCHPCRAHLRWVIAMKQGIGCLVEKSEMLLESWTKNQTQKKSLAQCQLSSDDRDNGEKQIWKGCELCVDHNNVLHGTFAFIEIAFNFCLMVFIVIFVCT